MHMRIVGIVILLMNFFSCSSQKLAEGCWMPESYIDSLEIQAFENIAAVLKPVQSVYVSGDTVMIMSFQGDYLVAQIESAGNGKLKVTNFGSLINLSYPEAINYAKKQCYLYQDNNYLMMDIGQG